MRVLRWENIINFIPIHVLTEYFSIKLYRVTGYAY